jgi:hypothetical protein
VPADPTEGYDRGGMPAIDVCCRHTIGIGSIGTNHCSFQTTAYEYRLTHEGRKNS